jgi:RND family efflux transporter MFP subunit
MVLSFRIAGVITRLAVDDGDVVRRGQVLAELDDEAVSARFHQAQAELSRAEADNRRAAALVERGAISRQQAEAQEAQLATAQAAYAAADFDRRWTRLVAPADGVVLARVAQAGEVVQPGQVVLSIADAQSPLVLRAPLADRDAARLRMGAPAQVTLDALPGEVLAGHVSRIAQRAGTQTGAIEFEVTLPARPGLRSGLIARASLPVAGAPNRAYDRLPAEAVLEADKAQAYVMLYDAARGVARKTAIRFAGFEGDDALVTGLPRGARVVTAGAGFISDGQRVTVVAPGAGDRS